MGSGVVPIDLAELAPLITKSIGTDGQFDPKLFGEQASQSLAPLWLLKHFTQPIEFASGHLASR